ncbi:hypothetical protein Fcan01_28654 [Folsomia candida]|uniref:Uncharacterized protein n=1 Tax=Folsomia candida TaxID=158441 RepID=A0A226CT00_FOLCA|nr:hypothetical protein Fcan01_28654 [Folsomia candida]
MFQHYVQRISKEEIKTLKTPKCLRRRLSQEVESLGRTSFSSFSRRQPEVFDAGFVVDDDEEEPSGPFTDEEEDEDEEDEDSPSEPEEDPDFVPANEHSQNKRRREARENAADAKKVDAASKKELDAARRNPLSCSTLVLKRRQSRLLPPLTRGRWLKRKSPQRRREVESRVFRLLLFLFLQRRLFLLLVLRFLLQAHHHQLRSIEAYVPSSSYKGPISLNFAPEGERSDDPSGQNIVHWEGQLDDYRTVHFIRKTFESKFPTKLHPQSAGYDLYCQSGALLKAGEMILMDIGIQVKFRWAIWFD